MPPAGPRHEKQQWLSGGISIFHVRSSHAHSPLSSLSSVFGERVTLNARLDRAKEPTSVFWGEPKNPVMTPWILRLCQLRLDGSSIPSHPPGHSMCRSSGRSSCEVGLKWGKPRNEDDTSLDLNTHTWVNFLGILHRLPNHLRYQPPGDIFWRGRAWSQPLKECDSTGVRAWDNPNCHDPNLQQHQTDLSSWCLPKAPVMSAAHRTKRESKTPCAWCQGWDVGALALDPMTILFAKALPLYPIMRSVWRVIPGFGQGWWCKRESHTQILDALRIFDYVL